MHPQNTQQNADLIRPLLPPERRSTLQSFGALCNEMARLSWEIIKTTPDYIFSYDFSLMLIAMGFILSRINEELPAPAIIASLNMYGYVSFMADVAAVSPLAQAFGEITFKKEKIQHLIKLQEKIDKSELKPLLMKTIREQAKGKQYNKAINIEKLLTVLIQKFVIAAEIPPLTHLTNNQDQKEEKSDEDRIFQEIHIALKNELLKLRQDITQKISTVSRIPRNVFYAALFYDIPLIVSMFFSREILIGLGQDEQIAESVRKFLIRFLFGFGASLFRIPIEIALLSFNKQKITMRIALVSLIIATGYEIPASIHFGLEGLATVVSIGLMGTTLGFAIYTANAEDLQPYSFLRDFINHREGDCKEISGFVKETLPTIFAAFSDIVIPLVIAIAVENNLGNEALKKQNVVVLASTVNLLVNAVIAQIIYIKVSQGRGRLKETKADQAAYIELQKIVYSGIMANVTLQFPLAVFVCATPSTFIAMMGSSAESDDVRYLLMLSFLYMMTDNIRYLTLNAMRALGKNFWSSLISTLFLWLGVGVIHLVDKFADLDILDLPLIMFGAALGSSVYMLANLPKALCAAQEHDVIASIVIDDDIAEEPEPVRSNHFLRIS